jgi:hypothetical protein
MPATGDATLIVMDYQGGGYQTGPRHVVGDPSGPQQALARGYPPGRAATQPQPQAPGQAQRQALGQAQAPGQVPPPELASPPALDPPPAWPPVPTPGRGPGSGPGTDPGPRKRGGRLLRRPVLLGAAAVLILGAAAGIGSQFLGKSKSSTIHPGTSLALPTSNPTAGSPYFSAKLGKWQHISTRKLDPAPLSVNELYPPAFMPIGSHIQYTRATAAADKNCTLTVLDGGGQLQNALQSGKCTQVVRASYVSGDGKMMGTIGVVNLSTATAAQKAGQVTGADQFIAPLSGSRGPTKNLLKGTGVVYAEVKGHYLILMYAEFTNLKSPSTAAQKQQLVDFAKGMFAGSANISLSTRMLTGKPA